MKKRTLVLTCILMVASLGATGLSQAGRRWLNGLAMSLTAGKPTAEAPAPAQLLLDVEQRARTQHGWSTSLSDSVVHCKVTFYDEAGNEASSGSFVFYRMYADYLRVEATIGGTTMVYGVDSMGAWMQGGASLTNEDARDIRAFLRIWPERLFVARAAGAPYREAGSHVEDYSLGLPGGPRLDSNVATVFDQVEMQDTIQLGKTEKRKVYYYVNHSTSKVCAVRYLEPDDPSADPDNPNNDSLEARVDFEDWHVVNNVVWPYRLTHRFGGKIDYVLVVTQVQMNQGLGPTFFQRP